MSAPIADISSPARNLWIFLAGAAAMAVTGWLLAFPLLFGEMLIRQLVGSAIDAPWTPFGADPDGKTQLSLLIVVVVGIPLTLLAIAIERALRRRLRLRGGRLVFLVALLTPFLLARTDTIGIDTMLGNGWLW